MKRSLFLLPLLLLEAAGCSAHERSNFTGSWEAPDHARNAFSLDLTQVGNRLIGYHAAVALGGKRLDAVLPTEGAPSILGTVAGKVACVHFRSGYDESGRGEASLMRRLDGGLEWKIMRSTGTYYLPATATLQRRKSQAHRRSFRTNRFANF